MPNHCSAKNVDQEFFKRVRAAYYVVSGNDPAGGEPSRGVLDALLEGKATWGSNLQVLALFLSLSLSLPAYMQALLLSKCLTFLHIVSTFCLTFFSSTFRFLHFS